MFGMHVGFHIGILLSTGSLYGVFIYEIHVRCAYQEYAPWLISFVGVGSRRGLSLHLPRPEEAAAVCNPGLDTGPWDCLGRVGGGSKNQGSSLTQTLNRQSLAIRTPTKRRTFN